MTVKAMEFNERNIPFQTEADVVVRAIRTDHLGRTQDEPPGPLNRPGLVS
jgi:hypothetical protein